MALRHAKPYAENVKRLASAWDKLDGGANSNSKYATKLSAALSLAIAAEAEESSGLLVKELEGLQVVTDSQGIEVDPVVYGIYNDFIAAVLRVKTMITNNTP